MSSNPAEAAPSRCRHCGTPTEGAEWCCQGCEAAFALLSEAGLDDWYERRTEFAPRPEPAVVAWDRVQVVDEADGTCSARLVVDGLRCASCVWVAEHLLQDEEGVVDAHLSYATGRARVRWDPARTTLPDIVGRVTAVGYRPRPLDAAVEPDRDLLTRLGLAAFCTANLMGLVAAVYAGWFYGMQAAWADLFRVSMLVLATPVATYSAAPFFAGAWRGLRAGVLHMDLPVSIAVAVLYLHGLVATLNHADGYLDSMSMLVTLLLVGRVLEARGRRSVQEAVGALASHLPAVARRLVDGGVEDVSPSALTVGDLVEVPPGTEVPADGRVIRGRSTLRMALVTGESDPVGVGPGDEVVAGAVNEGDRPLRVEVTHTGSDTLLGQMTQALENSLETSARAGEGKLASAFIAGTLLAAGATFAFWQTVSLELALAHTVAVLVVACPCALSLARPLTTAAGLAAAARRGLLLREGAVLARLSAVKAVVLDKTGTVTGGVPEVIEADDAALRVAAGLERNSAHPVGRAILREALRRGIALPDAHDVVETAGVGLTGWVDEQPFTVRAGGPGVVALHGPDRVDLIRLRDVPRPDAADAIAALRALGLEVALLTGDRAEVADEIAAPLGVVARAEVDPLAKAAAVEARSGVLFVGDGINDGPALVAADVGLAMGGGASSSILAADGVVSREALGPVVAGVVAARVTEAAVWRSLVRSVLYNVVAVAAAMAGFINPLVAAVLMPLSSLMVVWEASRVEARVAAS